MLSPRRASLLKLLIGEYVATATPVASEVMVRKHGLPVSSATVRNDLAVMEREGYVGRPHISAGAVPQDKGYRYYVEFLLEPVELPTEVKLSVRQRFGQAGRDIETWPRLAAQVLSRVSHSVAIATFPKAMLARLRSVEMVYLHDFLALLIVVLQEARVCKELVPLQERTTREDLVAATNKLNHHFAGLLRHEALARQVELTPLEEQVLEAAVRLMRHEEQAQYADCFVEGLRYLLEQPEFAEPARTRDLMDLLEEEEIVRQIVEEAPDRGWRAVIGEENRVGSLKPFSVVVAPYGVPGESEGVLAIVGPTRMEYTNAIASVRYLASLLNELSAAVYGRPTTR
ncbi:MAG: heat-inducible transcription repressor HrcA [Chloroflexi bacterium]|nr:heat-inducible transcription repressor HrcA [Chloroflexota bacterium]